MDSVNNDNALLEWSNVLLEWDSADVCIVPDDPSDFIYETTGRVVARGDGGRTLIGKFRLYYVDIGSAFNDKVSVHDVFDTYAQTFEIYEALFEADSIEPRERVQRLLEYEVDGLNVLILDRLEILPAFRGSQLGLAVMRAIIQRFSAGVGLVAIKPFPLQFEHEPTDQGEREWRAELGLADLPRVQRVATAKLCAYYKKLGFLRLRGTPFMVRSVSTRFPALDEVRT
jgi:hypothetical protein